MTTDLINPNDSTYLNQDNPLLSKIKESFSGKIPQLKTPNIKNKSQSRNSGLNPKSSLANQ